MGTVVDTESVGEPLLCTGDQGVTDYTFRQLRQLAAAVSAGATTNAGLKVTAGGGMSVNVAAGPAWVEATDDSADRYFYPVPSLGATANLSGITAPTGATRRDQVVLRVYDNGEDALGTTANAQLQYIRNATETTTAEAVPNNSLLVAYVDVTVGAGSITTAMITDMRSVASTGGQRAKSIIATAETTTSTTYVKLTTPDQVTITVADGDIVRVRYKAQWKISVATGTQVAAIFLGSTQLKYSAIAGAPSVAEGPAITIGTFYSHIATTPLVDAANRVLFDTVAGSTADVTDVTTGQLLSARSIAGVPPGPVDIHGLAAGTYVLSVQFKTSANTLTVRNRNLWAEVLPFPT